MSSLFIHHDHDVIGRLVVDKQLPVTVAYDAAAGKLYLLQERIRVGALAVVVAHHLQRKKSDDIDHHDDDSNAANDSFSIIEIIIFHYPPTFYERLKLSHTNTKRSVRAVLVAMLSNQWSQLKNENVSSV